MFDEFVQNSSKGIAGPSTPRQNGAFSTGVANTPGYGPSGLGNGMHLSGGFEPPARAHLDVDPVDAVETGFVSTDVDDPTAASPIFELGRVQYAFPAPLSLMTVCNNILTMCLYAQRSGQGGTPSFSAGRDASAASNPRLVRINLDDPERTEEAEVPLPPLPRSRGNAPATYDPTKVGPHKMFSDPTGRHLLLSCKSGDNFYWASGWKKARALPKLKGIVVESVAWNRYAATSSGTQRNGAVGRRAGAGHSSHPQWATTREILLGTRSGDIFEVVLSSIAGSEGEEGDFLDRLTRRTGAGSASHEVDKVCRHLFSLQERQPLTGLIAEPFPASASATNALDVAAGRPGRPRGVVIATTSTRIYEFVGQLGKGREDVGGEESMFDRLFEAFRRDAMPNLKSELPGSLPYSELHTWAAKDRRTPKALAWLTGPGIYHGLLSFGAQDVGDSVIDSANLLPYPAIAMEEDGAEGGDGAASRFDSEAIAEVPLSIALTEFHFVLLYRDKVLGISSLDDRVVFQESLPLKPYEQVLGTTADPVKGTYWIYTDGSIFELVVRDEDRDVWKVYLARNAHESALRYVKTPAQRDVVLSSQGDRFFGEARYIQAAQCYAQTYARTFEEIVLRFLEADEKDALRYYLVMRLERLRKEDRTQRMMLATWLVEIYLSRINELEEVAAAEAASQDVENYKLERSMLEEELRQFLVTYRDNLHPRTTYQLISRHGRNEVKLHYAELIGDHERIVRHWISEGLWLKAIDALNRQNDVELYYQFATVLMHHAPAETVDCWQRQRRLHPRRLVPALVKHQPPPDRPDQAVRYLQHLILRDGNTDVMIHNLLVALLARSDRQEKALVAFIVDSQPNPITGQPCYDLDYALRTCAGFGRQEACVRLFAKMGQFESAVDMALGRGNVELACSCAAEMAENDEELRKKLWLRIAKHVVETQQDIKAAMEFVSRTDVLSIEDILPFFPDFVLIDDFREEICGALEGYAARIEALKEEMDEASRSADAIRADTARLANRFVTVEEDDKCAACELPLFERQFYVFPCCHGFHADCLISETTRHLPPRTMRRLLELQEALSSLTHGSVPAPPPSYAAAIASGASRAAGAAAGLPMAALDKLLLPDLVSAITAGVSLGVASSRRVLVPTLDAAQPLASLARPRSLLASGGTATGSAATIAAAATNGTGGARNNSERTVGAKGQSDAAAAVSRADGAGTPTSTSAGGGGGGSTAAAAAAARAESGGATTTTAAAAAGATARPRAVDEERLQELRDELDLVVASSCVLCDGSVAALNRPFVASAPGSGGEGVGGAKTAAATAMQAQQQREAEAIEAWAL